MGGDGYYPEYYLRKRKRDRMYTMVWRTVFAVVVLGGLGALCGFLLFHYVWQPHQNPAGMTKLANTRNEIGTEQKLAQAAQDRPPATDVAQYGPVDLKKLQYSDSGFPATSVSLQGIGAPAGSAPAAAGAPSSASPDTAGAGNNASGSGAAGGGDSGTVQTPPPAETPAAVPPAPRAPESAPAQAPPPAGKPDEAKAAADKAAEKKAADAKKAQADKEKADKDKAAKEAAAKDAKPAKDETKDDKAVKPGRTVFRVYGGSAKTKDQAEALKKQLSTIGYNGQILAPKGSDFLVLVAEMDDYSKADALASDLRKHGFAPFTTKVSSK